MAAIALALSGCATAPGGGTETTPGSAGTTEAPSSGLYSDFSACMISDAGGFDDKSFNQSSWEGVVKAEADFGIVTHQAESQGQVDYVPNLESMQANNCDITITVGFLLKDATEAHATNNPDSKFAIVDDNTIALPNVKSLVFKTSEAAFLAGYVAAGYSKTGTVATFGGLALPTVTIFMDGFVTVEIVIFDLDDTTTTTSRPLENLG